MKVIVWALTRAQFEEGHAIARERSERHEKLSFINCSLDHFDPSPSQLDQADGAIILRGHPKTEACAEAYEKMGAKVAFLDPEESEEREADDEEAPAPKAPKKTEPKAPKAPKAPKKTEPKAEEAKEPE